MPAPGETSLPALLSGLTPRLHPLTWIYVFIREPAPPSLSAEIRNAVLSSAKMTFREMEGVTAIIPLNTAIELGLCNSVGGVGDQEHDGLQLAMPSCLLTLEVQSSLEAVGMMGAVAKGLADANVPCNVVAGFLHDHLFVPVEMRQHAMDVLVGIQNAAAEEASRGQT